MKKGIFALVAVVFLFSCEKRKNNNAAEQLDGGWLIEQIIKGGSPIDESAMPQGVLLEACKVSDDACTGIWNSNNGDTGTFTWTVTNKGASFTLIPDLTGTNTANQATSDLADYKGEYEILILDDNEFKVQKGETRLEFKR